ncbi:hypothetical protein R1flu_018656 [Riccia fluitans]|uniref:Uncharacterized protein n=1 Tax=Riccia fluitans TaxID=41844 RepID=A0ABD1ZGG6_9MARC
MLKNNTRIIAFNPRFSNLVTRECLEKLAGTRKPSSNPNQHRAKDSSNNNSTTSYRPTPEDDFSRRLDTRTKNPRGIGGGGARRPNLYRHGHQPKSTSSSSVANKFSGHSSHHQQQVKHRRVFRNRRANPCGSIDPGKCSAFCTRRKRPLLLPHPPPGTVKAPRFEDLTVAVATAAAAPKAAVVHLGTNGTTSGSARKGFDRGWLRPWSFSELTIKVFCIRSTAETIRTSAGCRSIPSTVRSS